VSDTQSKIVEALVAFDLFPCEDNARALIEAITAHVFAELVRKAVAEAIA
jgi:hypothetical protein